MAADVGLVFTFALPQEGYIEQAGHLLPIDLTMAIRARQHDVVDVVPLLGGQWVKTAGRLHRFNSSDDVCAFAEWTSRLLRLPSSRYLPWRGRLLRSVRR